MKFSDKLKHYINGPHGMTMGTRDANLKPEYHRVLGTRVMDDQHIKVFVDRKTAGRTLQNLEDNQIMSVVMCSLENFESFQLKGRSVNRMEMTDEERRQFEEYMNGLNEGCVHMGFPDMLVMNYPHSDMITLVMEVEELYEQTPKVGTGQKVMM